MRVFPCQIGSFPYADVLPFLKEHVQPSDQMLVLGCGTELPLQLSRDGYGTRRVASGDELARKLDFCEQKVLGVVLQDSSVPGIN